MRKANQKLPTFLYVMPFGPNKIFLEETSLVSRPPFDFKELKERLDVRYILGLAFAPTKLIWHSSLQLSNVFQIQMSRLLMCHA